MKAMQNSFRRLHYITFKCLIFLTFGNRNWNYCIFLLTEALRNVITIRLKITNKEWLREFDDKANLATRTFVGQIENSVSPVILVKQQQLNKTIHTGFLESFLESEIIGSSLDIILRHLV